MRQLASGRAMDCESDTDYMTMMALFATSMNYFEDVFISATNPHHNWEAEEDASLAGEYSSPGGHCQIRM